MKIMTLFLCLHAAVIFAQDKTLPYYEIPDYPEKYSAGAVAARMIDGLGHRFYWATEGLRQEDLQYKPGAESRTSLETIQHIYEMSLMIRNTVELKLNVANQSPALSFEEMRKIALHNLKAASDQLRTSADNDLKKYELQFKRGERIISYPYWNLINGPIADCIWHVGQIVSFRRSSGNPFSEKVSVLNGKIIN